MNIPYNIPMKWYNEIKSKPSPWTEVITRTGRRGDYKVVYWDKDRQIWRKSGDILIGGHTIPYPHFTHWAYIPDKIYLFKKKNIFIRILRKLKMI